MTKSKIIRRMYFKKFKKTMKMNNSILYSILGNLYGDGGVYGKGIDRIIYNNKEIILAKKFKRNIENLFNIRCNLKKRKDGLLVVTAYNSPLSKCFLYRYGQFTSKEANPKIKFLNDKNKIFFLRSLFDDEGSISKDGIITLGNSNVHLINLIRRLLEDLGFKSKLYKSPKYKYYVIRLSKLDNKKFYEMISFKHPKKKQILENNLIPKELQVQVDLNEEEDKKIGILKTINKFKTKEETIKNLIKEKKINVSL